MSSAPLRLLYLGMPLGALCFQRAGHTICAAGISRPDAPGMRRLRRCLDGAPLFERPELNDPSVVRALAATRPDLVVSWFWTRRIPRAVIALAPLGGINVHPSLLPRHRGADPYFWTLRRRDARTGVTVHRIEERYDTGAILLQRSEIVPPGVDSWRLARHLDRPSLDAMHAVLDAMQRGEPLPATPQDESLATFAPTPSDDDCELRWSEPAEEALALVRAAGPEPGAFTEVGEEVVVILDGEVVPRPVATLRPGEVVLVNGLPVIACGLDALRVTRARSDEGAQRVHSGLDTAALFPAAVEVSR